MDIKVILLIILDIAVLIFGFISMKKEKDIVGFYKAQGLFGPVYAYFTANFLIGGVAAIVIGIISVVNGSMEIPNFLAILGAGIVGICVGVFMYVRVYKKCQGELKKRVLLDMIMVVVGFSTRLALFFLVIFFHTWFELNKPTEYEVNGRKVYAYPGSHDLYNSSGCKVGVANDDYTKAVMD